MKENGDAHDAAVQMSFPVNPLRRTVEEDRDLVEWARTPGVGAPL